MVQDIGVWNLVENLDPVEESFRECWGTLSGK
jgi:hypothetical protein